MKRVLISPKVKIKNKEDLSSNNFKKMFNKTKEAMEIENVSNKSDIWNINPILSIIFSYSDHKDLINFNTVCKKWYYLTNSTIHRSIKLVRNWDIIEKAQDKTIDVSVKIDPEVTECISNNSKHAAFIEEFKFNYKLDPQRAIEFFETFRFICNLAISSVHISQDQFLGMISPLNQLRELTLSNISIKMTIRKRIYNEAVQLPPSLKKLRLEYVSLIDNPELSLQTINSHNSLVEFSFLSCSNNAFLKPFYKHYPSLASFEDKNNLSRSYNYLIKIFRKCPQLTSLNISPRYLDNELIGHITKYLVNLEEFIIAESKNTIQNFTDIYSMFYQSTKIKKLVLILNNIRNRSLDPILLNSPYLEELNLNGFKYHKQHGSKIFISLSKSVKIKKLSINCEDLRDFIAGTLYLDIPNINELNIALSVLWKEAIEVIYEKSENLQKLAIYRPDRAYMQELDIFYQEFYKTNLFVGNPKCKSTLTHLTLNRFKAVDSKASHFKNFEKLKSIKYPEQNYYSPLGEVQKMDIDMDMWPSYVIFKKEGKGSCDIEFKRL
jgi:hypothetical protein